MRIGNPKEAIEALKDREAAYTQLRAELARKDMTAMCYYEGAQWIARAEPSNGSSSVTMSPLIRLTPQMNPDVAKLRVTANRVARFIQKAAAATYPQAIDAEVNAPDRAADSAGVYRAQVCEDTLNAVIDESRLVAALRSANFTRCITGAAGVGLTLRHNPQTGSAFMEAFDFPATNLTMDPANCNPDLHRHEYVIYSDIWTANKARRVLGITLNDDELSTVGQLSPLHQELSRLTSGRLFAQYVLYSRTKGVRVHQMHERGDDGQYRQMFTFIEKRPGNPELINAEDPSSPYGGDGMPLILFTGHRRGDKTGWIGDVAMLKDDQDAINLWKTIQFRQAYSSGSPKIVADRRGLSAALGKTPEAFATQFSSSSGTYAEYDSGTDPRRPAQPPYYLQAPPPQPYYQQAIMDAEMEMREQVHRAELNMGVVKSHVPASTDLRARQAADEVFGQRVQNDVEQLEQLLPVALGTTVILAQNMSPSVIQCLQRAGLDEQDLGELLTMDPHQLPVTIKVRESSIRYRSQDSKKQDVMFAVQTQQMGGAEFRRVMARDLDTALTTDDGLYAADAERVTQQIIAGAEWEPRPLAQYSDFYISAFRRGMVTRAAKLDPSIRQRLTKAIISQKEADAAERAIEAGSSVMGQQRPPESGSELPQSASLDELASLVDQQSSAL